MQTAVYIARTKLKWGNVGERSTGGFRGAWRHRRWRWLLGSYAVSMTGDFLYFVALVVLLIEETGSAGWVAAASVLRILAYVILGPFGGAIADRYDRRRLMIVLDLGRFAVMSIVAVVIGAGGHVAVVIALTVVNAILSVPYRSAAVAATPNVVDEDDLAAANAAEGVIAQAAFFIGPALGTLVVALTSPAIAFAINGLTFLVSAALVARIGDLGGGSSRTSQAVDVSAVDAPSEASPEQPSSIWGDVVDGGREVARHAGLLAIMALTGVVLFQSGAERVLHVLIAQDLLGKSADWVGVMAAAMAVGGLLVAPFTARLGASRYSGALLAGSGVVMAVPLALLGSVSSTGLALTLLGVQGVGVMAFEVTFITLLQRWCREDALSRVFGLNDSLSAATEIVGAVLAPILVTQVGLQTTLIVFAVVVSIGSLATGPMLHRETVRSEAARIELKPKVEYLRSLGIFEDASQGALERIARSVREVQIAGGVRVFAEGETADDLYVVRSGEFVAESLASGRLSVMGPGEWFGEIGILRQMPRTATVSALADSTAWQIDGPIFAAALAGPVQAQGLLSSTMTSRLARTHPHQAG